jgi:3-hydroxyisobutyrate dehydrogenase
VELGATVAETPEAVGAASDVVISMVGYPSDVRTVLLGSGEGAGAGGGGALSTLRAGGILVDMTTSEPSLAREVAAAAAAKGCGSLDAPVSGGDIGAREARLSIMVGGEAAHFEAVKPLLEVMGKNIRHMGPAGAGQSTKCVNQVLVAASMIGACEALLFARKAGLDLEATIAAVGAGAAGSWTINNLGPRIARGDFEPGFFVEHFLKDLGIVLSESRKMGLALPGLALAEQLYLAVKAQGHAKRGTQALWLALEALNGIPSSDAKRS